MKFWRFVQQLVNAKYRYVLVTILVSVLAFARNLVFMKSLDLASLGQITLMTTLIMLVGFAHVGLVNGAYIQYAAGNRDINRRIVSLMAAGILVLSLLTVVVALALQISGALSSLLWSGTLVFGLVAGIATLASTWMNNTLIADGNLGLSNLVNVGAVLVSLLAAFSSAHLGLVAAWVSLLLQPLLVAVGAMMLDRNLRIRSLRIDSTTALLLFRIGVVPFLGGLTILLMHQFERWSIAAILGPVALGEFYIVLMYTTFFGLIPTALLNMYFPQTKRAFATKDHRLLSLCIKHHQRDLILYFLLAVFASTLLMPTTINWYLPEFTKNMTLVFYALPGLILITVRNIASMVFYSTSEMRPLVLAGILTLFLFSLGLFILWVTGLFTLVHVLIVRAVSTFPGTVYLLIEQHRALKNLGELNA